MDNTGRGGRVSGYIGWHLLKATGFTVQKVTKKPRSSDIIAWKHTEIIGLVIRTSRSKGISGFSSLVAELGKIVQKRDFPGENQVWIAQPIEGNRHRVLPGGVISCSGGLA